MKRVIALALLLASCGGDNDRQQPSPSNPSGWDLGPTIGSVNYSHGGGLVQEESGSWAVLLPVGQDGVHYVTQASGPLTGKQAIVLEYTVELGDGAKIVPSTDPAGPSVITPYFQRCGDDWSGVGKYEAFRWWGTFASQMPITEGSHKIIAPLDGDWSAVETSHRATNPAGFADALAHACRVGFTLGGGTGFGHGVYATGPAKIIVDSFRVM